MRFLVTFKRTVIDAGFIEAESESAARQAWIDEGPEGFDGLSPEPSERVELIAIEEEESSS